MSRFSTAVRMSPVSLPMNDQRSQPRNATAAIQSPRCLRRVSGGGSRRNFFAPFSGRSVGALIGGSEHGIRLRARGGTRWDLDPPEPGRAPAAPASRAAAALRNADAPG